MSIYQGGTKPYPEWEEEQQKLKIRTRPVGSKATLNGKPVVWAGPDYGWQSPESFKKLDDAEYFAPTEHLARTGLKVLNKLEPVGDFIGKVGQGLYEAFVEPYQGPLQKQIMTNTAETLAAVPEGIGYVADKATPHGAVGPATGLFIAAATQELIENKLIGKLPRRINRLKKRGKLTGSQINAAITPEGVLNRYGVYRKNPITGKKERVPLPDESALPTLGRKDQHHWIPKDTRHDFTQQANKLDPKGQAELDAIDVEYGLQAGGGEKGVTTMDMGAHLPLHGRIRSAGYELSGTQLKAFKKEIAGIKDIEQLKVVYRDWLEKNVIPTLSTVEALQGGYELLEAGGKPVTKEALLNAAYGRGGWMDRQLSIVENRIDAAIQAGRTPRRADILFKARAEQDVLNNLF